MKKIIVLTLLIPCIYSCLDNKKVKNSLAEKNLKGNVSFVEKVTYAAEHKFGEIQNGILKSKYTYKYDEKGNNIEGNWYDSDGSLEYKYTFEHDDKGNEIEMKDYNSDGSLDYKQTFDYEYDKSDNWIKKVSFNNGKPETVKERLIEYY
jgi:hypothetical protein